MSLLFISLKDRESTRRVRLCYFLHSVHWSNLSRCSRKLYCAQGNFLGAGEGGSMPKFCVIILTQVNYTRIIMTWEFNNRTVKAIDMFMRSNMFLPIHVRIIIYLSIDLNDPISLERHSKWGTKFDSDIYIREYICIVNINLKQKERMKKIKDIKGSLYWVMKIYIYMLYDNL